MVFKNFRFQIVLRVLGIGLSLWGFIWSLFSTDFLMTPLVFGLFTVLQLVALIYYSEWTIRELKRFFESFTDSDYTRRFEQQEKGRTFKELGNAFNRIVEDFRKIRIEKEEHYQYLLQVNEHINVGLICFTDSGRIDLMNSAACTLLDKPPLNEMRMIQNADSELYQNMTELSPGEKVLYKIGSSSNQRDLAIVANKFKLGETNYTLISLQNIRAELDAQEMQAWQKLIRVLTHEIMNSVTPVVSLTTAVKMILQTEESNLRDLNSLTKEEALDVFKSINAIESRGKGLLEFVNAYRDYTRIPTPVLQQTDLVVLVGEVLQVLKNEIKEIEVNLTHDKNSISCDLDKKLIDQVLINLIKNASEAVEGVDQPKVMVHINSEGPTISVQDNGPGIPENILDEIFVPFYTTKPNGNGIGLSLSKQIMKAHGGDIIVESNIGTTFQLLF